MLHVLDLYEQAPDMYNGEGNQALVYVANQQSQAQDISQNGYATNNVPKSNQSNVLHDVLHNEEISSTSKG